MLFFLFCISITPFCTFSGLMNGIYFSSNLDKNPKAVVEKFINVRTCLIPKAKISGSRITFIVITDSSIKAVHIPVPLVYPLLCIFLNYILHNIICQDILYKK